MGLPEVIEITPLTRPVEALITVPGSKSISNRAMILAALGQGTTHLCGALWSEDTQVMAEALQTLGFEVSVAPDPEEMCNRTITIRGLGGRIPHAGTAAQPLEIFVGNAGTAARFLAALACLGQGVYRLHGVARMHERPQCALFDALRELGYRIQSPNNKLPALIYGAGPRTGRCRVSIGESSQFASALLLCGGRNWEVEVVGANRDEQPYVEMTRCLVQAFPRQGGSFQIEPDASSGSYFLGAAWILHSLGSAPGAAGRPVSPARSAIPNGVSRVTVRHWPESGWQIDADFLKLISTLPVGAAAYPVFRSLPDEVSREHDLGDSIMTAAVLAPLMGRTICLTDLGRLRVQETERVAALRTELTKCGARVLEEGDTLTILPSPEPLHGAEIETYNDHRMAMCFAILGLKIPGLRIKNPACVKKTFPNFFQKLAAPPPHGLGATIRDAATASPLPPEDLFAA